MCETLKIPQSTCTSNIKILEAADLVESRQAPGVSHGTQKICSLKYTKTLLPVISTEARKTAEKKFCYSHAYRAFYRFFYTAALRDVQQG
jgi:predicted transcriptional regulator